MAEQDMEQVVRQMRRQLERTPLSRRGFMWASAMSATAAFLAACSSGGGTASSAPSAASEAPSTAPSDAASVEPSQALESFGPEPSFEVPPDIEKELFMYNWSGYVDPNNMKLFQKV